MTRKKWGNRNGIKTLVTKLREANNKTSELTEFERQYGKLLLDADNILYDWFITLMGWLIYLLFS